MTGSALGQVILLLASPILTHLYSTADFGIYAVFLSTTTLLGMVAAGRYELAIMLPEKYSEAIRIYRTSLTLSLLFSCLVLLLSAAVIWVVWEWQNLYKNYWWWLAPAVFLQGAWQCQVTLLNRQKRYSRITNGRVAGSLGLVAITIALGWLGWGATGMIAGKLAGQGLENLVLGKFRIPSTRSLFYLDHFILKRYRNFFKYSTLEGFLNTLFKQVPVYGLTAIFGSGPTGLFSHGQNISAKPMGMLGSAMGQVFYQRAVIFHRQAPEQLPAFFRKNLLLLAALSIPFAMVLIGWGPSLFAWIFGEAWRKSGYYAAWLVPFTVITFMKAPLSSIIDIKNKIRENLLFEWLFLGMSLLAMVWGWQICDPDWSIQVFSIGNSVIGLFQLLWFYRLTYKNSTF